MSNETVSTMLRAMSVTSTKASCNLKKWVYFPIADYPTGAARNWLVLELETRSACSRRCIVRHKSNHSEIIPIVPSHFSTS